MSDVPNSPRWPADQVLALAPDAAGAGAARRAALPGHWSATGCDVEAVWGLCIGSGGEPYQVVVELAEPAFRCSCPSRKVPCKHALGLLLVWSSGLVPDDAVRPVFAAAWLAKRAARQAAQGARDADPTPEADHQTPPTSARQRAGNPSTGEEPPRPPPDQRAIERAARVAAGLGELDRWLDDCLRNGLTAPALARYSTWEVVAARLVDAQAGSLANRVRRVAGKVGVGPSWHEEVLAELGGLHLLARAGLRLAHLPSDLADSVRGALGFTVRQADVLARAPERDRWMVVGRSDTLEDRIVVRRWWLRADGSGAWALSLSFAAYGQQLDGRWRVGDLLDGDVHRYPGRRELRAVIAGMEPSGAGAPVTTSLAGACEQIGAALGEVPWLERWPITVRAAPTLAGGRWVLADATGTLPLAVGPSLPELVAVSGGGEVALSAEWTAGGLVPLAVHLADRHIDIGPRGGFHERRWRDAG